MLHANCPQSQFASLGLCSIVIGHTNGQNKQSIKLQQSELRHHGIRKDIPVKARENNMLPGLWVKKRYKEEVGLQFSMKICHLKKLSIVVCHYYDQYSKQNIIHDQH